jgi:transcriptional regulator with XRE-family HTH domain
MSSTPSSTIDRARFAHTLRELRERAGLGGVETARLAGISQSKISKLENGKLRPSPDDIRALCDVYGVSEHDRDELVELAAGLRAESHLTRVILSRDGAAKFQQRIGRLEARAHQLRSFQPGMVIGLLQTADYARTMFAEGVPAGENLDRAVAARMRRKSILNDEHKQFVLILSEGALRWQVGNPAIMAAQIDEIAQVSRRPNVRLGIVPWTTPMTVTCTHAFHIYDNAAVVVGTEIASGVIDEPDDIAVYDRLFEQLDQAASYGDDARRELARIANDYRLLMP